MNTTIEKLLALHAANQWENDMVYSVWEDGEITLEKGGALFGQRSMHTIAQGLSQTQPYNALPVKNELHSRIFVVSHEHALLARQAIKEG